MLLPGSHTSYIRGVQLLYIIGHSNILDQRGDSFEVQVPAKIKESKVWIHDYHEYFGIRGLESKTFKEILRNSKFE